MTNPLKRGAEEQIDNSSKRRATEANVNPATHLSTSIASPSRAIAVPRRATTSNIKNHLQSTSLTKEQEQLRQKIEVLAKGAPRFLFRFWSEESGGNSALNTIDRITPHAFHNQEGPEALHNMKVNDIQHLAAGHVCGQRVTSVFSSWSQSLPLLLSWARSKVRRGAKNMHISVLDTTKVHPSNIILHTEAMCELVDGRMSVFRHEYLIFGIIKAPAHRAVSFDCFEPPAKTLLKSPGKALPGPPGPATDLLLKHIVGQPSVERKIDMINQIAQRYGSHMEVPVAAHLMAFVISNGRDAAKQEEYLAKMASTMPIPAEWATDIGIMAPDVDHHHFAECYKADKLLSTMVAMKHVWPGVIPAQPKASPLGGTISFKATKPKQRQPLTKEEAKKAADSVLSCERVPEAARKTYRMVADLLIESKGYEESNRHIEDFKKGNA